jgi:hypothetical protein
VIGLALFLLAETFQAPVPLPTIEAKAPKDLAMVLSVNETLSQLSQKVTACVDAGRPAEICRCSYPHELTALRTKYDDAMTARPEWKDQLVSYQYVNKDGRNISGTMVFQNLRRQLETLRCS